MMFLISVNERGKRFLVITVAELGKVRARDRQGSWHHGLIRKDYAWMLPQ
jgi:hypothetical protein